MNTDILLVQQQRPARILTLNRPQARNALDLQLLQALALIQSPVLH